MPRVANLQSEPLEIYTIGHVSVNTSRPNSPEKEQPIALAMQPSDADPTLSKRDYFDFDFDFKHQLATSISSQQQSAFSEDCSQSLNVLAKRKSRLRSMLRNIMPATSRPQQPQKQTTNARQPQQRASVAPTRPSTPQPEQFYPPAGVLASESRLRIDTWRNDIAPDSHLPLPQLTHQYSDTSDACSTDEESDDMFGVPRWPTPPQYIPLSRSRQETVHIRHKPKLSWHQPLPYASRKERLILIDSDLESSPSASSMTEYFEAKSNINTPRLDNESPTCQEFESAFVQAPSTINTIREKHCQVASQDGAAFSLPGIASSGKSLTSKRTSNERVFGDPWNLFGGRPPVSRQNSRETSAPTLASPKLEADAASVDLEADADRAIYPERSTSLHPAASQKNLRFRVGGPPSTPCRPGMTRSTTRAPTIRRVEPEDCDPTIYFEPERSSTPELLDLMVKSFPMPPKAEDDPSRRPFALRRTTQVV